MTARRRRRTYRQTGLPFTMAQFLAGACGATARAAGAGGRIMGAAGPRGAIPGMGARSAAGGGAGGR